MVVVSASRRRRSSSVSPVDDDCELVDASGAADDCDEVLPCASEDVELTSVDCWVALELPETLWSPLPTFTPGLTLAEALRSLLLTPTFAFKPTFGLTLSVLPPEVVALFSVAARVESVLPALEALAEGLTWVVEPLATVDEDDDSVEEVVVPGAT